MTETTTPATAAVIGAGPAGLMAAEVLAAAGLAVSVYDHMPSPGRKLLMAGRGGLNLTHAEPLPALLSRYAAATPFLTPIIEAFPPAALIEWAHGLGQETFIGSSQRVFPRAMKASPLLRAWLNRLRGHQVRFHLRHRWLGWSDHRPGALRFDAAAEIGTVPDLPAISIPAVTVPPITEPSVTVLALGGASWPRLGADARWTALLPGLVRDFRPANCGFAVAWSDHLRSRFAGQPVKRVAIRFPNQATPHTTHHEAMGDMTITASGLEGTPIYALSGPLRDTIARDGAARITIDLRPDLDHDTLADRLSRGGRLSIGNRLRRLGLAPPAAALVQEALLTATDPLPLPQLVKAVPLLLDAPMPIARAISSAGGIRLDAVTDQLMLRDRPGVFVAGEMLDWEAPTGGYLLQACFSTGVAAARGALNYLQDAAP
jgi:uncharacterized flavoprotein (TIGR03862 family)